MTSQLSVVVGIIAGVVVGVVAGVVSQVVTRVGVELRLLSWNHDAVDDVRVQL